jgi:hypothetical protein
MLNEPLFKFLFNVFTNSCKYVLERVVNGSKWKLCSFFEIDGAIMNDVSTGC